MKSRGCFRARSVAIIFRDLEQPRMPHRHLTEKPREVTVTDSRVSPSQASGRSSSQQQNSKSAMRRAECGGRTSSSAKTPVAWRRHHGCFEPAPDQESQQVSALYDCSLLPGSGASGRHRHHVKVVALTHHPIGRRSDTSPEESPGVDNDASGQLWMDERLPFYSSTFFFSSSSS